MLTQKESEEGSWAQVGNSYALKQYHLVCYEDIK